MLFKFIVFIVAACFASGALSLDISEHREQAMIITSTEMFYSKTIYENTDTSEEVVKLIYNPKNARIIEGPVIFPKCDILVVQSDFPLIIHGSGHIINSKNVVFKNVIFDSKNNSETLFVHNKYNSLSFENCVFLSNGSQYGIEVNTPHFSCRNSLFYGSGFDQAIKVEGAEYYDVSYNEMKTDV